MRIAEQIAIIYCGIKGLLLNVPLSEIKTFEKDYLMLLHSSHQDMLDEIGTGKLSDKSIKILEDVCGSLTSKFNS